MNAHGHHRRPCLQRQPRHACVWGTEAPLHRADVPLGKDDDGVAHLQHPFGGLVSDAPMTGDHGDLVQIVQQRAQHRHLEEGFVDENPGLTRSQQSHQEGIVGRGMVGGDNLRALGQLTVVRHVQVEHQPRVSPHSQACHSV